MFQLKNDSTRSNAFRQDLNIDFFPINKKIGTVLIFSLMNNQIGSRLSHFNYRIKGYQNILIGLVFFFNSKWMSDTIGQRSFCKDAVFRISDHSGWDNLIIFFYCLYDYINSYVHIIELAQSLLVSIDLKNSSKTTRHMFKSNKTNFQETFEMSWAW